MDSLTRGLLDMGHRVKVVSIHTDKHPFLPDQIELTLSSALDRLVEPEGLSIYADRVEALEAEIGRPVR